MVLSLRKLFWIFAALAAMVLLAPMAASAHERHAPAAAVVHAAAHQHHASGSSDRMTGPAALQAWVAQPGEDASLEHDALCTSGCCLGIGCCAGTILSDVPDLTPPCGPPLLVFSTERRPDSAPLTSLLEPPNALA